MTILNTLQMTGNEQIKAFQSLANAVFDSAFKDLRVGNFRDEMSAQHFFEYGNYEIWADMTGTEYKLILDNYHRVKEGG